MTSVPSVRLLSSAAARLFLLVDAARDPDILPLLAEIEAELAIACLWQGDAAEQLPDVAPYLVELDEGVAAERLMGRFWGRAWGVVVESGLPLASLRRHFRRFVLARLPGGEVVYFRFYDPRVLRTFLPVCEPDQLAALFTGVDAFLTESKDARAVMRYRRDAAGRLDLSVEPLLGAA